MRATLFLTLVGLSCSMPIELRAQRVDELQLGVGNGVSPAASVEPPALGSKAAGWRSVFPKPSWGTATGVAAGAVAGVLIARAYCEDESGCFREFTPYGLTINVTLIGGAAGYIADMVVAAVRR